MTPSLRLVDHQEMDLSAALLVVAFPGVGLVGSIATNFLVSTLKLERVASVESRAFPPMAILQEGRLVSPVRVHAAPMVCGVDGRCDQLAVVAAEVAPRGELLYDLSQALLEWAVEKRVVELVALEGFVPAEGAREDGVFGAGNNRRTLDRLAELGVQPLRHGILSGTAGPLAYLAESRGLDVTVLLAATSREYPDAGAAVRLLEVLNPIVPRIDIDPQPLRAEADRIESQLTANLQRHSNSLEDMASRSRIMYG